LLLLSPALRCCHAHPTTPHLHQQTTAPASEATQTALKRLGDQGGS
jgi:hypothetical protein